jgi:hypothetical protein
MKRAHLRMVAHVIAISGAVLLCATVDAAWLKGVALAAFVVLAASAVKLAVRLDRKMSSR